MNKLQSLLKAPVSGLTRVAKNFLVAQRLGYRTIFITHHRTGFELSGKKEHGSYDRIGFDTPCEIVELMNSVKPSFIWNDEGTSVTCAITMPSGRVAQASGKSYDEAMVEALFKGYYGEQEVFEFVIDDGQEKLVDVLTTEQLSLEPHPYPQAV